MKNEIEKREPQTNMQVFSSQENFEQSMKMAKCLSVSSLVPAIYQDKEKGLSNCIIALEMANRIKMSPLMVMQNLYIVHGNVGWSSKFLIAVWNTCGRYSTIKYEFEGDPKDDTWGCRATSTDKDTGEILKSALVTIKMAKEENWYQKSGSKWKTLPELMLQYRSAAFLVRAYAPELSMGLQTIEEVEDIRKVEDIEYQEIRKRENDEVLEIPEEKENDPIVKTPKEELKDEVKQPESIPEPAKQPIKPKEKAKLPDVFQTEIE